MSDYLGALILAVVSSGAFSALISGIFARANYKKEEQNGVREGVRVLLYDRLKFLCKRSIKEGSITADQLEDIISMHKVYHNIGGNGFLDSLINQVKSLPIVHEKV